MPVGIQTMPSNAEAIELLEHAVKQTRWICKPERHEVTIVGWKYHDYWERQDVLFEVREGEGRCQFLRFGLTDLELGTGRLANFITTVLQQQLVDPQGMKPHIVRHMRFNQLVGRRVLLVTATISQGVQVLVDWEAVPKK